MGGNNKEVQAKRLVIGGIAGTLAKTVVAPLERVRIMAQTGHGSSTMFQTGSMIIKQEGVAGLWRGNFVNCVRVFPSRGILFSCNDLYKSKLTEYFLEGNRQTQQSVPFWLSFTSGAFAGMTSCILTYPLDVARTRMSGRLVKKDGVENRLVGTLGSMLRKEGLVSWYRGVGPTLAGSLPYEGIKFAVFDWCIDFQTEFFGIDPKTNKTSKLISGAVGGAAAGLVMFPNDTVRRLLQMQGLNGAPKLYSSAWDCWVKTYKKEGVSRFFRGIVPYLIRMVPNSALQFGAYEILKRAVVDN